MNPSSPRPRAGSTRSAAARRPARRPRWPGDPVRVAAGHLGVRRHEERGEPQARGAARRPDGDRQAGQVGGEPVVGLEPVADGRLVAVVELEHVEGPVVGQRQVGGRTSASVTSWKYWYQLHQPTWKGAPTRAPARRPASSAHHSSRSADSVPPAAVATRTVWSARRSPALEHGVTQEGLDPQLDAAPSASDSRNVPSWRSPPSKPTRTGASGPWPSARTVTHSERSSPGRARRWSAWWTAWRNGRSARHATGRCRRRARPRRVGLHDWYPLRNMRTGASSWSSRWTRVTDRTAGAVTPVGHGPPGAASVRVRSTSRGPRPMRLRSGDGGRRWRPARARRRTLPRGGRESGARPNRKGEGRRPADAGGRRLSRPDAGGPAGGAWRPRRSPRPSTTLRSGRGRVGVVDDRTRPDGR